jgi:hypothetical protein
MSQLFIKNTLNDIFSELSETNNSLDRTIQVLNATDKTENATSSAFMHQIQRGGKGKMLSTTSESTSSAFIQQGGNFSPTSVEQGKDVNKLVSMLTSDSNGNQSDVNTDSLEEQLRKVLRQDGGKRRSQKSSNDLNINDVKRFFTNLKTQGVNVNVKLNNKSMTEFFGSEQNTTTDLPMMNAQMGGKNPGFLAFAKLKNYIAEKLGIKAVAISARIASVVNKEMKQLHEGKGAEELANEGIKHFDKHKDKYKKMADKIASEKSSSGNNKHNKKYDSESKSHTSENESESATSESDESESELSETED